ncbi:MAG: TIR domain-containing protein [Anaeromicrobium sp.]|jgi:hypothetical protein|uniref:toll/interleukin-1 receptor domain-containing protein n=1 Tax=Anaeromicrobium sp. TaxID=1929132 RepID=UPI0025D1DDE6|nr:SEFIR domain-containing protein [Anaeromicrobium sp.]MCT4594183.1 TIR domain-containing protein [Anaeromicrobium sp.]
MENCKEHNVFISYSWTSKEHATWVRNLAERLLDDGIEVKLDQWDLKPGNDKYAFMESMVQDESIDKVLIVCDSKYKEKADARDKGVGVETQIITPEIYNKTTQQKFIPIVAEVGEEFDSHMPSYLKARIGIDMSSEDKYEEGYEQLLRLIYDKPQFKKPSKGKPPAFLFEDKNTHFKTSNLNKQLKHFLIDKPNQADYVITQFIEEFLVSLEQFTIESKDFIKPYDEQIYINIEKMLDLRNDYINFLSMLCKLKKHFDIDIIINLFEELYKFTEFQGSGTFYDIQTDHYKLFINEIFLYTTVILIENEMFEKLNTILSTKYFVKSKYDYYENGASFTRFRFYIASLDEGRKKRLNSNKISITAQLLVDRSKVNGKDYKENLLDADLLLHYISDIKNKEDSGYGRCWFPTTYVYKGYRKINLLKKIVRKKHFDKVKLLFNVDKSEDMKELVTNYKVAYRGYDSCFESIPNISNYINVDEIAKYE